MFSLTGSLLFWAATVGALAGPILLVLWLRRSRRSFVVPTVLQWMAIATCQILALASLFFYVNNAYGFYTSWSDLLGRSHKTAQIQTNGLIKLGQGRVELITVPGTATTGGAHQVLVWLPPEYTMPRYRDQRFPVLMVLPGQPSTPSAMFRAFNFGSVATEALAGGRIRPFIAVFPPLMTNPPRDTECTNISAGPQAETWLSSNVYRDVNQHLRVNHARWGMIGYSTGGFCAAKLLLHHPSQYAAAVGIGGYYETLTDKTTGNLFGGRQVSEQINSPLWLYRHGGLHHRPLLLVSGKQDHSSYRSTQKFLATSRGDPDVALLTFSKGGHNYRNYRDYLPEMLGWLQKAKAFG